MPPRNADPQTPTPDPSPAPAAAPAPEAPPAERLSPAKWTERLWSKEARKTRGWLLKMVEHKLQRAADETGEPLAELTQAEFEEACAAAAGHQVLQHHTPPEKE